MTNSLPFFLSIKEILTSVQQCSSVSPALLFGYFSLFHIFNPIFSSIADKPETKVSEGKSITALKAGSNNIKAARNYSTSSLIHNQSTSVNSAIPAKTNSDRYPKEKPDPPKRSIHTGRKEQRNLLAESISNRKEKPRKSNIVRKLVTKVAVSAEKQAGDIVVGHSSGTGMSQDTDSNIRHDTESDTSMGSGNGSDNPHGGSGMSRDSERHAINGQTSGTTNDSKSDLTRKDDFKNNQKGERIQRTENSPTHNPADDLKHRSDSEVTQKPKGVVIVAPQIDVKHNSESISDKPSKIIRISKDSSRQDPESDTTPSHHLKVSSRRSAKKSTQGDFHDVKHDSIAHTAQGKNGKLSFLKESFP